MKRFVIMIKPASSLCDMRCAYCFYHDVAASRQTASMGVMGRETAAALIKNVYCVLETGDEVTFAFQGGEPGLAGLDFYRFFTGEAKKASPSGVRTAYAIQTNGLTVDGAWCGFFKDNDFLVGLSMDGDAALHNQNRVDARGRGTYNRVAGAKKTLDRHGVPYNILCVLTAESARRATRIWNFIIKENIGHIQFIPCLESLGANVSRSMELSDAANVAQPPDPASGANAARSPDAAANAARSPDAAANAAQPPDPASGAVLDGDRFYRFYSELFPLWKSEAARGRLINVRLFEDIAGVYISGRGITCGISGRCMPQIVVEADGGAYPCDFYVLDKYRVADLSRQTLKEVFEAVVGCGFIGDKPEPPAVCAGCAYFSWCRGGCKRMARAVYGEHCGMKRFLDECLRELLSTYRV